MRYFIGIILAVCLPATTYAATNATAGDAKTGFNRLNRCVQQQNTETCRSLITADSVGIYDRFTQYGLTDCLPDDAKYVSEQRQGAYTILRASTAISGKPRFMRLAFVREEKNWKLDIPESLRIAMGENWKNRLNTTEQLYLVMKQQFGGDLNCNMVRGLLKTGNK